MRQTTITTTEWIDRNRRTAVVSLFVSIAMLTASGCSSSRLFSPPFSSTAEPSAHAQTAAYKRGGKHHRRKAPPRTPNSQPGLEHKPFAIVDPDRRVSTRLRKRARAKGATHVFTPPNAVVFVDVDRRSSPAVRAYGDRWSARSAEMMVRYFGRFPVPTLDVELRKSGSGGVGFGQHFAGESVVIRAGSRTDAEDLRRDWVLPHEMFHTAFPSLAKKHRWMREGLSTYLESVIRSQAGVIEPESVWKRWDERFDYGLPDEGEGGLDHTRSWGSMYWGGTFFWFLVDTRLRAQTNNEVSLQTALAAILAEGGHARWEWPMERVLRAGDKATNTRVFHDTYAEVAEKPYRGDVETLFEQLGVSVRSGVVSYNDDAEWAHVRKALLKQRYSLDAILPIAPLRTGRGGSD